MNKVIAYYRVSTEDQNLGIPAQKKTVKDFAKNLKETSKQLGFTSDMLKRSVNEGFSGGEKKRYEIPFIWHLYGPYHFRFLYFFGFLCPFYLF